MAYRVVQLHNGLLEFDSVEGQGATFTLRIPLNETGAAEQAEITSADSVNLA
jgi:signal transduction histidine kinase